MKIREDFLPMSRPSIGNEEISQVVACLKSGWITTGPLCNKFEEQFCKLTGAKYAVSVSSGTAGMHITLLALGLGDGDEIITPSLTFASTINLITILGAKPVFVDVDYGTLNLDTRQIKQVITKRTRAIIPVHFAGAPVNMDEILDIAKHYKLHVIEDAAHALGTYFRGIHAGGFGHTAIFSFHPIKNITTGEGGMITLNNEDMEKKLRLLRFHGIERDAWKRYGKVGKGGNPEYDITTPGFKYNLTDMQAAIGLVQLSRLNELNRRRKEIAEIYMRELKDLDGLELPGNPPYEHCHAWHLFIIKILAMERRLFMKKLGEYNIGYGVHFPATHLLTYIRKRFNRVHLKVTEDVAQKIVSLPLFPEMSNEDVHYVCQAIKEIMSNYD